MSKLNIPYPFKHVISVTLYHPYITIIVSRVPPLYSNNSVTNTKQHKMKTIQERRSFNLQKAKQEQERKTIAANENTGDEAKQGKPAVQHKRKRIDHKTGKILANAALVFAISGLTAYSSAAQEPGSTKKMDMIGQEYQEFREAYKTEVEHFKKESKQTIAENKSEIARLRTKIAKDKKLANSAYKNQVEALEQQNKDMEKKISNYRATSDSEWRIFKTEFGKDMNALGTSLKNFMKDSKK